MHQPQPPIIPQPLTIEPPADDYAQWNASRLVGAIASAGLLCALWLPWFRITEFRAGSNRQEILAGPGYDPVHLTAMAVSQPLSLVIAGSALAALVVAAVGPLDDDGRWDPAAMGVYWFAATAAFLAVSAIAFGFAPLPDNIPGTCAAQAATASQAGLSAACANLVSGELRTQLLFGAGISIALSLALLGSAAWSTARQPGRE